MGVDGCRWWLGEKVVGRCFAKGGREAGEREGEGGGWGDVGVFVCNRVRVQLTLSTLFDSV